MKSEIRREGILNRLKQSDSPVSANVLASEFGVSRQIIVKDIATLRECGCSILSMARGYALEKAKVYERVFKVKHTDEETEEELNTIVDCGGTVRNVFIYHKAYDVVSANLNIRSRTDIKNFIDSITSGKSSLLKNVTSGYHYHTVTAESESVLDAVESGLRGRCFLAPLQEYEPESMVIKNEE